MNSLVQQMQEMVTNPLLVKKSNDTSHISRETMNSLLQEELQIQNLTSVMAVCGVGDPGPDPTDDPDPEVSSSGSKTPQISKEAMNSFPQEELPSQDLTSIMAICGMGDPGPDPTDDPDPEVSSLGSKTPYISKEAMNSFLQGGLPIQDLTSIMAICAMGDPGPDPTDDPNPEVSS